MKNNKEILKHCPNFYNIINFDITEEDMISETLVKLYQKYIFNVNLENDAEISRVEELDKVLNIYIEDYEFRGELQKEIVKVKVKKDTNVIISLIESILKIFTDYEEYTTRKIYIAKWI